jgi:hypothetical protein
MDRTLATAAVVFAALAIAGTTLIAGAATLAGSGPGAEALRLVGVALLGGGLAAFLGEAFRADRLRRA